MQTFKRKRRALIGIVNYSERTEEVQAGSEEMSVVFPDHNSRREVSPSNLLSVKFSKQARRIREGSSGPSLRKRSGRSIEKDGVHVNLDRLNRYLIWNHFLLRLKKRRRGRREENSLE